MPVTFGSVGDVIAVAQLVKGLVEALDKSRGSQTEYRQLVQDLQSLEEVLCRVDNLCNNSVAAGLSFEIGALHQTALQITESCRKLVQSFTTRLKKYDAALGETRSGKRNVVKSAVAKIRWQVGKKEDVVQFRTQIAAQAASLNLFWAQQLGKCTYGQSEGDFFLIFGRSVGKDTQHILGRMESNTSSHFNAQAAALSSISDDIADTNTLVKETKLAFECLLSSLSKLNDVYAKVKSTLNKIIFINVATYKMVLAMHNRLISSLERPLIQEPFFLEDAIGRVSPVHLQFISSWAALGAVLVERFRGLQGYDKVVNGQWMLQNRITGREVSRKQCWEGAFLPGQKIDMSMLFQRETTSKSSNTVSSDLSSQPSQTSCPACQKDSAASGKTDTTW